MANCIKGMINYINFITNHLNCMINYKNGNINYINIGMISFINGTIILGNCMISLIYMVWFLQYPIIIFIYCNIINT